MGGVGLSEAGLPGKVVQLFTAHEHVAEGNDLACTPHTYTHKVKEKKCQGLWAAPGLGVKSGVGLGAGVPKVLTAHPDSPPAASGGSPGAGSHKSRCFPLLDMGFGRV